MEYVVRSLRFTAKREAQGYAFSCREEMSTLCESQVSMYYRTSIPPEQLLLLHNIVPKKAKRYFRRRTRYPVSEMQLLLFDATF
jgi:hypothetical protein